MKEVVEWLAEGSSCGDVVARLHNTVRILDSKVSVELTLNDASLVWLLYF